MYLEAKFPWLCLLEGFRNKCLKIPQDPEEGIQIKNEAKRDSGGEKKHSISRLHLPSLMKGVN